MRALFIGLLFLIPLPSIAFAVPLPASVTDALKQAHIPLSSVGIVVRELHESSPIISLNADQAMNPASTMKLLTTFAALETLGPAYRWKTEAYLNGKLENGILDGDLVFKGYGDPKLTVEQFWLWLRELRQRGLREIHGDIVLDHSFFESVSQDPAEFDNDPTRAYNVGTNALLLNFNALHLRLIPNGHETVALLEPGLDGYTLHNHITTSKKMGCNAENTYKAHLDGHDVVLEGSIPATCGETDDYFSLLPHDEYFFAVFGALWQELGGTLHGKLRSGTVPADQVPFAKYVSPPLSEVIRDINKFSNNTMARQLFLALGTTDSVSDAPQANQIPEEVRLADSNSSSDDFSRAPAFRNASLPKVMSGGDNAGEATPVILPEITANDPLPANIAQSTAALRHWLITQQLQFPELVLENGAGLSRKERISAQHLSELLERASLSPFHAELEASLPILGMDGTAIKRLRENGVAGYAHLKTGSLKGVKSIAGYVQARSGKRWIVVFLVNHANAAPAQYAQDALIEWLQKEF